MGQEDGYIQIDYETQIQRFIPKSDIPEFAGKSSYEALTPEERVRMEVANAQIAAYHNQEASTFDVDNGEYSFVGSNLINYMQYTGVVLVAAFDEGVYKKHGTGFMLDSQHFMTALHVVSETNSVTDEFVMPLHIYDEIRVYFGITESIAGRDFNTFFDSDHTDYVEVSLGTLSSAIHTNSAMRKYDWYIGTLETPVNDVYFFDCYSTDISIMGTDTYMVGYPGGNIFEMVVTYGQATAFYPPSTAVNYPLLVDLLVLSNVGEVGISGGPVYTMSSSLRCHGVFVEGTGEASDYSSVAVSFYDDLLDVIADLISS